MNIFPAIDLKNAEVVRLTQGDYSRVEVYSQSPAAVARSFAQDGAAFLHVVDLDGAKDGALSNYDAIKSIVAATGMYVEVGGGIRTQQRIERYLALGVGRVILGTAVLKDFDFLARMVQQYGEKIAVGVDARDGRVATDGWLHVSDVDGVEFCKNVHSIGVPHVIYTDIACDGAMRGTNLPLYARLAKELPTLHITASGGISTLAEIESLAAMGTHSVIVGKAIYTGALVLKQVLAAAGEGKA